MEKKPCSPVHCMTEVHEKLLCDQNSYQNRGENHTLYAQLNITSLAAIETHKVLKKQVLVHKSSIYPQKHIQSLILS